jgi:hypothetical protein
VTLLLPAAVAVAAFTSAANSLRTQPLQALLRRLSTTQNDLVLDEVGTALHLVARAPGHDRHCGGRVLR